MFTTMVQRNLDTLTYIFGGLFLPNSSANAQSYFLSNFIFDFRFMFQSAQINIYGNTGSKFISSIQGYDCPSAQCIGIWQGAHCLIQSVYSPLEIFGKDNIQWGIRIQPGAILQYYPETAPNSITITGNTAQLGIGYFEVSGENDYTKDDLPVIQIGTSNQNGIEKIISMAWFISQ